MLDSPRRLLVPDKLPLCIGERSEEHIYELSYLKPVPKRLDIYRLTTYKAPNTRIKFSVTKETYVRKDLLMVGSPRRLPVPVGEDC